MENTLYNRGGDVALSQLRDVFAIVSPNEGRAIRADMTESWKPAYEALGQGRSSKVCSTLQFSDLRTVQAWILW